MRGMNETGCIHECTDMTHFLIQLIVQVLEVIITAIHDRLIRVNKFPQAIFIAVSHKMLSTASSTIKRIILVITTVV